MGTDLGRGVLMRDGCYWCERSATPYKNGEMELFGGGGKVSPEEFHHETES